VKISCTQENKEKKFFSLLFHSFAVSLPLVKIGCTQENKEKKFFFFAFPFVCCIFAVMNPTDKNILKLAIPSIISNITVPLIGLVDLTIIGHIGSAAYIGAISVGTMIFNVIYWMFGFLRMGNSGMASQALGRGDNRTLRQLLLRSMAIAVVIGLLLIIMQHPLRELAIWVIAPSKDVTSLTAVYFHICIWGAPAVLSLYGLNGWFIGMQNTKIPMFVAISQNIINVVFSLLFVLVLKMKIEGVAYGALIAQWSGWLIAMFFVIKRLRLIKGIGKSHSILKWGDIFKVNRDIFIRTFFLVSVNLSFIAVGARHGDIILSVNTLLMTFFTIFSYIMDGFAFAAEALCGKAYGEKSIFKFSLTVKRLMRWGLYMALAFTLIYIGGGHSLLRLITNNKDVISAASPYMSWAILIPLAGFMAFVLDGIYIGSTATHYMLISSFVATICFYSLYFSLEDIFGNHALWMAFILFLLMRGLVQQALLNKVKSKIVSL
jgi:MATE family multidrug resistance protein